MAKLNPSKIWRLSGSDMNFKDWLNSEKQLYRSKIESGKIQGRMSFLHWLNMRWKGKLSTGELSAGGIGDVLSGITSKVVSKLRSEEETEYMPETEKGPKTRILGLKPIVFYSITGIIITGAAVGIYILVKKIKK